MILLLLMLIVLILFWPKSKPAESTQIGKDCPPHKWTYNHKDQMQCTVCNFIAGTYKTENGDY